MTTIDLREIGNAIAKSAKNLQKLADNEPQIILVKSLVGKIPTLKPLGEDFKIFKMRKTDDGGYKCLSPSIWRDDEDIAICDSDLKEIENAECLEYQIGIDGFCILQINNLCVKCDISYSEDAILESIKKGKITGEGLPDVRYLADKPSLEIALYSSKIPTDTDIVVITECGKSKKFNTPMYTLKIGDDILNNVIGNAHLQKMHLQYGDGLRFKIAIKRPKMLKGKAVTADGQPVKKGDKPAMICDLVDLQIGDFADLVV